MTECIVGKHSFAAVKVHVTLSQNYYGYVLCTYGLWEGLRAQGQGLRRSGPTGVCLCSSCFSPAAGFAPDFSTDRGSKLPIPVCSQVCAGGNFAVLLPSREVQSAVLKPGFHAEQLRASQLWPSFLCS